MMKRLLLTALVAPLAIACGSDDSSKDGGSNEPTWQGKYLLNIPENNWVEPDGIGDDVGAFVKQFILDVDGDSVTLGPAKDGEQDTCSKTSTLTMTGTPPNSTIGPESIELFLPASDDAMDNASGDWSTYAVLANIKSFSLTDVLPNGDTTATEGELRATADARDLWPLFYIIIGASPDTVCGTIDQGGDAMCEPCDDDEPYCLTMVARGLGAEPFTGSFETVSESCEEVRPPDE